MQPDTTATPPSQPAPSTASGNGTLGTFAGVFTPSILTILGLVLFLRMGYVVGSVGLMRALVIILAANIISVLTSFSLAAIATNFDVKGGGDYFLISRTLGLGFGAAIGIILFIAQSVSIGFYCIGLAEAVGALFPRSPAVLIPVVALLSVLLVGVFAWLGTDWATRFQFVIMALLALALASFAAGASEHWQLTTLISNLGAPDNAPGFWVVFAVFFPAVTGFTQGVSMSGDLRDPGSSIPFGTFSAVALSGVIYGAVAILLAGAMTNATLADDMNALKDVAALRWLVTVGVLAATLSSALASFVGAPRILQALAQDRVLPILKPFAAGVGPSNNPRRGVLLSGAIGLAIVVMGDLNMIASIVSMFFLASYALVNYATYFEAGTESPHFRPRFRWYDRRISLFGVVACVSAMLAIDAWSACIAAALLAALYHYLTRAGVRVRWADSRRSNDLQLVRRHLLSAEREEQHPRDWRPFVLAFSDTRKNREKLLRFASWIEGGSGLTTVVNVVQGSGPGLQQRRETEFDDLAREIKDHGYDAFPLVLAAKSFADALPVLIQSAGIGPIRTNTVLVNWIGGASSLVNQWTSTPYGQNLRTAFRMGCNLVILDAEDDEWQALRHIPARDRVIDIWWTNEATGRLTLLLAYLMTRSDEWRGGTIRVFVPLGERAPDACRAMMDDMLDAARIEAALTLVEGKDSALLLKHSAQASIVFLPLEIRSGRHYGPFGDDVKNILPALPAVVMVMAAQNVDLATQPDEGKAADEAAALDRFDDAAQLLRKGAAAAAKAEAAEDAALAAFTSAVSSGTGVEQIGALQTALRQARTRTRQRLREVEALRVGKREAERQLQEMGLALPETAQDDLPDDEPAGSGSDDNAGHR